MLDAAYDLLLVEGLTMGWERLSFERVVRVTGTDRNEAVAAWEHGTPEGEPAEFPHERFRQQLMFRVFERPGTGWLTPVATQHAFDAISAEGAVADLPVEARREALGRVLRAGGNAAYDELFASPDWPIYTALVGILSSQRRPDDDPLMSVMRRDFVEKPSPQIPMYEAIAATFGYGLRAPFTWSFFAQLVDAMIEGASHLQHRTQCPVSIEWATGRDGEVQEWCLFSVGLRAIVELCLEPDGHVDTDVN
jgi:hypothetical protein